MLLVPSPHFEQQGFRPMVLIGWSQGPQHQYHLGTCQKCDFLCLIPDVLSQKRGAWGPVARLSVGQPPTGVSPLPAGHTCSRSVGVLQESSLGRSSPPGPARWVFGEENSVEELMSSWVNFWQGINAHSKCTNVWFSDPKGEGGEKKHRKHTREMER